MTAFDSNSVPRFALRKRSIRERRDVVNLSSYNSDFLSGLFADVAKVSVLSGEVTSSKRASDRISPGPDDILDLSALSNKKSRLSLNRTLTRVHASSSNLSSMSQAKLHSPKGINEFFKAGAKVVVPKTLAQNHKHDSLALQLNCVSGSGDLSQTESLIGEAAKIAFPHLPATVSDSSCSAGLTRANLVRKVSTPENETKESFGWFVDLEDNRATEAPGLPYAVSSDDLAFQAPTAPRAINNDAEVEWAKAADTVDDVLGDFF